MYRDFIVKQTSDFDSQYKAKTLVGNWYEERCNPQNQNNFHFFKERKLQADTIKPTLTQENFQQSKSNWLNFQNVNPTDTFKTEYEDNYLKAEQQKRLSKLEPFITKKGEFQKNEKALNEYRQKWTKSAQVYDQSRTYIGTEKK